eukprot:TRINITY_DN9737_c0_g1_i5.p1 TRINITY_DN9737_c0_g1~~TRINITY_DN9737_c0_g1_i5.p1  ORF type:complete len:192 (-),score=63.49 TRINITY_DN9737_c0_g1_i5:91-666(-)
MAPMLIPVETDEHQEYPNLEVEDEDARKMEDTGEEDDGSGSDSVSVDSADEELARELTETLSLKRNDVGWDCESIISTYSNTENHPCLIVVPDAEAKIKLGSRGAPKLPHSGGGVEEKKEVVSKINVGAPRKKNETLEEKKMRKSKIKESRRQNRSEKKATKVAFKEEEIRQRNVNATNFARKQTVVQYGI